MLYLTFQISTGVFLKFMCCFAVPSLGFVLVDGEIVKLLGKMLLGLERDG